MSLRLLLRADASAEIGTGHVLRLLALAQAVTDRGGAAMLLTTSVLAPLLARVRDEHIEVVQHDTSPGSVDDARHTNAVADSWRADWVAVDGYAFADGFQRELRAMLARDNRRLLIVDDYGHAVRFDADIIVNQNSYADPARYCGRVFGARLLTGARHALLRREFRNVGYHVGARDSAPSNVLVTFGGGDAPNATGRVLDALALPQLAKINARVLIGAANPHRARLISQAAALPNVRLLDNVTDMAAQYRWADLAVVAGGSTCWELARFGVPVVTMAIAENQRPIALDLARRGVSVDLGWVHEATQARIATTLSKLLADAPRLAAMRDLGLRLVDGQGSRRVVDAMLAARVVLRRATAEDSATIYSWANDPATRAASFDSAEIAWNEHARWFADRLTSDTALLLIAQDGDAPVGFVRFERGASDAAVVSINIAPKRRGTGLGASIIASGCRAARDARLAHVIEAYIRPENTASLRAFEAAGFCDPRNALARGQRAILVKLL